MRFRRTRRLRIISGAALLLLLTGLPVLLGVTRPAGRPHTDAPAVLKVYATGLSSLGLAGLAALGLALVFGLWLIAGQRSAVHRKSLGKSWGAHRSLVETLRTLAVIFGAAGVIIGSLLGLYAGMMQARPDLNRELPLPFVTAELALICLLGGGALYAVGRVGR